MTQGANVRALFSQMAQLMEQSAQSGSMLIKSFDQISTEAYGKDATADAAVAGLRELMAKSMGIADLSTYGITGTAPLQLENLDSTMTEVLINEAFMMLFNAIPRVPSTNALYQWNRKNSYGSFRGTAGFREGGAPNGSSSKYLRDTAAIKYLGERGGITHQLTVAGNAGGVFLDPVAEENRNTTMRLLAKIERAIMRGRADVLDEDGNDVNYDGLMVQLLAKRPKSIIDLQGQPLAFAHLEEAAYNLFTDGKLLSFSKLKGFATGFVQSDLGALMRAYSRVSISGSALPDLTPGTPYKGWNSQFGLVPMEASQFLDEVEADTPVQNEADPGAPATPGSSAGVASTQALSKMPAATYYYFVASINSKGESLPLASSGVAVTSGQGVTVTIGRIAAATGYRIYRGTTAVAADARWIATVTQTPSANPTYLDLNQIVPGTGTYVIFNADPADIAIAQLAPLVKWPLAIVDTTIQFLLLLYHTLVLKAPERVVIFKNIGKSF